MFLKLIHYWKNFSSFHLPFLRIPLYEGNGNWEGNWEGGNFKKILGAKECWDAEKVAAGAREVTKGGVKRVRTKEKEENKKK